MAKKDTIQFFDTSGCICLHEDDVLEGIENHTWDDQAKYRLIQLLFPSHGVFDKKHLAEDICEFIDRQL